jgi:hypothetical protein
MGESVCVAPGSGYLHADEARGEQGEPDGLRSASDDRLGVGVGVQRCRREVRGGAALVVHRNPRACGHPPPALNQLTRPLVSIGCTKSQERNGNQMMKGGSTGNDGEEGHKEAAEKSRQQAAGPHLWRVRVRARDQVCLAKWSDASDERQCRLVVREWP